MAKSDLAVTIRCDVQPFVDGELMIAKRMNELVDAVNRANRQPASGLGAAVAGALVVAGSTSKTISRRRLFSFGLLR
jgi:hypothetical protein